MAHTSSNSDICNTSTEAPQKYRTTAENDNFRPRPWLSEFALWNIRRYFRSVESTQLTSILEADRDLPEMNVVSSHHEEIQVSEERKQGENSAVHFTPSVSAPSYIGSSWWSRNGDEVHLAVEEIRENLQNILLGLRPWPSIKVARLVESVGESIYRANILKDLKQANKDLMGAIKCEVPILIEGAQ